MQTVEKHIDPITHDDLIELVEATDTAPCISIYLPTERVWNESKQNPARMKNLVREAAEQLAERGLRDHAIDNVLGPAHELLERTSFWKHQSDGLALFLADGFVRTYRLPLDFETRVIVNSSFHIRPLLKYLDHDGRFYVLALNQGGVQLYRCTRHACEEAALEDVPTSLPEAMQYDDLEAHLNFHGGTSPTGGPGQGVGGKMFHGQGSSSDKATEKEQVMRFFRALDNGVRQVLKTESSPPPLVLAGLDYLQGLYKEANQYAHVTDTGVAGNPGDWDIGEMHRRAWDVVEPQFAADREQAFDDYQQLAASEAGRVAAGVDEVVPAAFYQRVDTLFVPANSHVWGTFNPDRGAVDQHEDTAAVDLLDLAVAHTLRNSGTVYVVDPADVPEHATVAAILRY